MLGRQRERLAAVTAWSPVPSATSEAAESQQHRNMRPAAAGTEQVGVLCQAARQRVTYKAPVYPGGQRHSPVT